MNLPDFNDEADKFLNEWPDPNVSRVEELIRKTFALGMKHAAQRIIEDEGAHYDCWINEEADRIEKGES